jgi:hypothetical protein
MNIIRDVAGKYPARDKQLLRAGEKGASISG